MKTTTKSVLTSMFMAAPLCMCLIVPNVPAAEASGNSHVPLRSMNQAEYERYREQLDRQMRPVTSDTVQQEKAGEASTAGLSGEETSDPAASNSGYGKGYRARMKMQGGAGRAGGFRGGATNRGGGGRNR